MPIIRPISDLRNKTPEIENLCIQERQPVFITKNGVGHLVVMSQAAYEEQQALLELFEKLDEAEQQSREGEHRPLRKAMAAIKDRMHAKA